MSRTKLLLGVGSLTLAVTGAACLVTATTVRCFRPVG